MDTQRGRKLNQLQHLLPDGLLAEATWMERNGYSSALRSKYVAHGWLNQPARGVYARPGTTLRWEYVVVSLQVLLRHAVIVGGRTALELQGFGHYLALGGRETVHLFADAPLPGWLDRLDLPAEFIVHNARKLFPGREIAKTISRLPSSIAAVREGATATADGLTTIAWGERRWPLVVSTPERAVLELLDSLPDRETFHQADALIEGLRNMSPRRLQSLLEACNSIKVKRLFLWFADRHDHSWRKRIDVDALNLGKGKRSIAKGGRLDTKYQITVPEDLHGRE